MGIGYFMYILIKLIWLNWLNHSVNCHCQALCTLGRAGRFPHSLRGIGWSGQKTPYSPVTWPTSPATWPTSPAQPCIPLSHIGDAGDPLPLWTQKRKVLVYFHGVVPRWNGICVMQSLLTSWLHGCSRVTREWGYVWCNHFLVTRLQFTRSLFIFKASHRIVGLATFGQKSLHCI